MSLNVTVARARRRLEVVDSIDLTDGNCVLEAVKDMKPKYMDTRSTTSAESTAWSGRPRAQRTSIPGQWQIADISADVYSR